MTPQPPSLRERRKPYAMVWKVSLSDPNDEEGWNSSDVLFTNERAGHVFARWAKRRWPVVVGPWEAAIYSSGSFAIRVEAADAPELEQLR